MFRYTSGVLRRIQTILCILSLVLCLTAGWLWYDSYSLCRTAFYGVGNDTALALSSDSGGLYAGTFAPPDSSTSRGIWAETGWSINDSDNCSSLATIEAS